MGHSFEDDYTAIGTEPSAIAFLTNGTFQVGANLTGSHIGVQGNASAAVGNFGVVGSVVATPEQFPLLGSGGVGVWGIANDGPGVAGTSSLGSGVIGQQGSASLICAPAGVVGISQNQIGVSGVSTLGTGVVGQSDQGFGIDGHSNKSAAIVGISGEGFGYTGGPACGIVGISNAGGAEFNAAPAGVVGTSDQHHGVRGTSSISSGVVGISGGSSPIPLHDPNSSANPPPAGVFGTTVGAVAVAGVASNSSGVIGQSGAPPSQYYQSTAGVIGAARDAAGVFGVSDSVAGVIGISKHATGVIGGGGGFGVHGDSDISAGVRGDSNSYFGVVGYSRSSSGVMGFAVQQGPDFRSPVAGVFGTSSASAGVFGTSSNQPGVVGYSTSSVGVYGETAGTSAGGGWAGYFKGDLYISGQIIGGNKSAIVPFSDGSHRLMQCMESPEHWFEDFGAARLKRGQAVVNLDADFANTIRAGDYRVFLTPEGDCCGLYVKRKRGDGFEVRELQGGTSNVAFSFRVIGRRRDIKRHKRFAKIDIAPPIQVAGRETVGPRAARPQAFTRHLRAVLAKHRARWRESRRVRLRSLRADQRKRAPSNGHSASCRPLQ
jgi:hypothetical protein